MAAPAPSPETQLSALLARFPADVVALAKRCRTALRRTVPCTHELVYDYGKSLLIAYGSSERGIESTVALAIAADAVRLYLDKDLPDPHGLLKGAGTKVRSVAVAAAADLGKPPLSALLAAAIERAGGGRVTGAVQTVFKESSRKRTVATSSRKAK